MSDTNKIPITKEQIDAFEERIRKRQADEDEAAKQNADELRQSYLRRTGRKEMKP